MRLYDVRTFQCFVASNPNDQHTAPITAVTMIVVILMYNDCVSNSASRGKPHYQTSHTAVICSVYPHFDIAIFDTRSRVGKNHD